MPTIVRNVYAAATLAGVSVGSILSARCSIGFDLRVAEAYITLTAKPAAGTYRDQVALTLGATPATAAQRFKGILLEYDYDLFPGAVTLVCRGNLYRVAEYENTALGGTDMTNGGVGQTDVAMVKQVLNAVPGFVYNAGNIGGTNKLLGTQVYADLGPLAEYTGPFAWGGPSNLGQGVGETALAFIERLDQISEGYRLFETLAGNVYRSQIYGRPRSASDFSFTEGQDIFSGRGARTLIPTRNRTMVSGYDFGTGLGPIFLAQQSSNPFQPNTEAHSIAFASPMIEKVNQADAPASTTGQSCEAVGNYLQGEYNREIVKLVMTTPRDDLIGPGQTHSILSPRLGITEPLWVQRVDIELNERGEFSQTISYIGGGTTLSYAPPPTT